MSIVVLGGDGYLGWPLSVKLALHYPDEEIVIVDNLSRRSWVEEVGGRSLTPVLSPEDRVRAFERIFGTGNLRFVRADVCTDALDALVERHRPGTIFHLAQQASAPYSMMDVDHAVRTVTNNETGNLRVLFAVRRLVPEAHVIKLGSFGEYAKNGLAIAEGYFRPAYRGRKADCPTPFPRESDDIYHITKINDTNFIAMACRKWGLRVTDIMQSTIFGVHTEETCRYPELYTRFDYDAVFGTVVNRFVTQAVANHPLTVYGTGHQRTGLMALEDSLNSMVALVRRIPAPGEHKVINHVTLARYSVAEIAEWVVAHAGALGHRSSIHHDAFDPRRERPACKADYEIETHYVSENIHPTPIEKVIAETCRVVHRYRDRIDPSQFQPRVSW